MSAVTKLANLQAKAAEKRQAEQAKKRADWTLIQEAIPDWAEFVRDWRKIDPGALLLHTEIDGEVIQTTKEYAELKRDMAASEARAKRNMDVEYIR